MIFQDRALWPYDLVQNNLLLSPIIGKENHVLNMSTTLKDMSYIFSSVAQVFWIWEKEGMIFRSWFKRVFDLCVFYVSWMANMTSCIFLGGLTNTYKYPLGKKPFSPVCVYQLRPWYLHQSIQWWPPKQNPTQALLVIISLLTLK